MKRLRLIEDWRSAWRLLSVNAMAMGVAGQSAWLTLPDDLKASVPHWLPQGLAIGLFGLGIVGRIIKQPALAKPEQTQ